MGGVRELHGAFEGTQGATRAEYEAAQELEKGYVHKVKVAAKKDRPKDDVYDWIKEWEPRTGEDGKAFAKRIMDLKYGKGKYEKGSDTEYSKAQKYADGHFIEKTKKRKRK